MSTKTKGNVIVEQIKVGDVHFEVDLRTQIKVTVLTKPEQNETGNWIWNSETEKGKEVPYLVNPKYLSFSPELYDYNPKEFRKSASRIKKPTNQVQEVLHSLLTNDSITVKQMMNDTGILNLSARLSDLKLKHNVSVEIKEVKTENKHGREIYYGKWMLKDRLKAREVYDSMFNG